MSDAKMLTESPEEAFSPLRAARDCVGPLDEPEKALIV
jgi:hypothetical protein